MRKRILHPDSGQEVHTSPDEWLAIDEIATVEVNSEDAAHPIEGVFSLDRPQPWRAAAPGSQTIRLIFDEPKPLRRIQLQFSEASVERTQEFSLTYSTSKTPESHEIVRQQWTFAPQGSTSEMEDYRVHLENVVMLALTIDPDRGQHRAVATLDRWRIA